LLITLDVSVLTFDSFFGIFGFLYLKNYLFVSLLVCLLDFGIIVVTMDFATSFYLTYLHDSLAKGVSNYNVAIPNMTQTILISILLRVIPSMKLSYCELLLNQTLTIRQE
jgi:hypothetical protein